MSYCSWLMSFMISDIMICALMFSYQQECFNTNGCWLSVPEIAPVDAKGPFSLQKEAVWTGDQSHRLPRQEEWGGPLEWPMGLKKDQGLSPDLPHYSGLVTLSLTYHTPNAFRLRTSAPFYQEKLGPRAMSIPSCQGLPSTGVHLGSLDIVSSLGPLPSQAAQPAPLVVSVLCCKEDEVPTGGS